MSVGRGGKSGLRARAFPRCRRRADRRCGLPPSNSVSPYLMESAAAQYSGIAVECRGCLVPRATPVDFSSTTRGVRMKLRSIFISAATVGLMVGPAFVHGVFDSVAGAKKDCTISGTAADDNLTGTTRDDVICTRAGEDYVSGLEGNDTIRLGQGDDSANGDDGSDVVKGQADDDNEVSGNDQNDRLFGGQGDDDL